MPDLISYIAAFLTTISFLPQAIKTIKSRDTRGISMMMYLFFVVGVGFWAAYGTLIGNYAIIIANIITFILAGTVLIIKIKSNAK